MADNTQPTAQPTTHEAAWVWQGFFGPAARAAQAKIAVDDLPAGTVGVVVPERGAPPRAVDRAGALSMFAVQVRPSETLPIPDGLFEAEPDIVGRLVGA